ncbi:MAG TPA: hypothetical protein VER76_11935, partial [Pyrinomonadaceae bacterium]|nr:hypothetical protein [Pyrinomonadaceae bacterium]
FDHGSFDLVVETNDGRPLSPDLHERMTTAPLAAPASSASLVQIKSARKRPAAAARMAAPVQEFQEPQLLKICRGCNRHVMPGEVICPHCDGDLKTLERDYEKRMRAARRAYRQLLKYMPQA